MRAITIYGVVMGVAAAGGQLLGGVLIDANVADLGWRTIFWINVPVGWPRWPCPPDGPRVAG